MVGSWGGVGGWGGAIRWFGRRKGGGILMSMCDNRFQCFVSAAKIPSSIKKTQHFAAGEGEFGVSSGGGGG